LLPENHFPVALDQISTIYSALASGDTGRELGFEVNRICVTGESAGGNLAAALCVKLSLRHIELGIDDDMNGERMRESATGDTETADSSTYDSIVPKEYDRMPDAIMLSCAALNLTTELSYSRVQGKEDPVLPNALISAISDAYLPSDKGFDKKDPLASPFFASDDVLRKFPPALLFASSKDPLLDDSVTFNERLRVLGVDSELIAAHNVPHAYLGLGTAGFPEAVQVQKYAMDWLSTVLKKP
jgi:acetyl esterase/lipase